MIDTIEIDEFIARCVAAFQATICDSKGLTWTHPRSWETADDADGDGDVGVQVDYGYIREACALASIPRSLRLTADQYEYAGSVNTAFSYSIEVSGVME